MSNEDDFENILIQSIELSSRNFDTAMGEVNALVASVNNALQKQTSGLLRLSLARIHDDLRGVVLSLFIGSGKDGSDEDQRWIADLHLPSDGYPMRVGELQQVDPLMVAFEQKDPVFTASKTEAPFENQAALQNWFSRLLRSPNSALVQYILYIKRQSSRPK